MEATPKQMLVGFDKLQSYLEKNPNGFDVIKIANTHNDKTNWRKEFNAKGAENIPLLIDYLQEWAPEGAYTWWICLYKGKSQVERFPFSKVSPTPSTITGVSGIPADFVNQLVEAERKAAIAEFQMNQMAQDLLEDEDEDEDEEPEFVGAIVQQLTPHIPALIEGLVSIVSRSSAKPLQVAGVNTLPDDVAECVNILMQHGVTINHLQKLVKKAQDGSLKPLLMML